jgi:hypothetical protein
MEQAIGEKFKAEFNAKWKAQKEKQDEELRAREAQLRKQQESLEEARRLQAEELKKQVKAACKDREKILQKEISEKLSSESAQQLQALKEKAAQQDEELRRSRQKELDFLRQMEALQKREEALELETQRKVAEERKRISEELRKSEEERYKIRDQEHQFKMAELEKKLEDQRKLAEEMRQKAEQGSMQLQGEIQELALEGLLRSAFPFDVIKEVPKGINGGDCILTVRNGFMQECGCIVFESKRTKAFAGDWIDKLKGDMGKCGAEIAVIVTAVLPKDMDRFGEKQGVYICTFAEVKSLVAVLRGAVMKVHEARKSQENKGDKMVALYDYLTGSEFMTQWNAMRESFQSFRTTLQKERDDFERAWKKKQKLLDRIIENSMQISGSIEGISGIDSMNWTQVQDSPALLLEE